MSEHRLDKIVIERPRSGMRISSQKQIRRKIKQQLQQIKYDYQEAEIGSLKPCDQRAIRGIKSKYFSDLLNPLYRWLHSQVGQPWDSVYGELSQLLEFNTLSGQHILVHVWEFVTRDVVIINGVPHSLRTNYRSFRPLAQDWKGRGELYVHPETGILGVARPQPRKKPQPKQDYLCIDRYHQYHKIEDIWYLVYFRDLPRSTVTTTGKTLPIKVKDVLQRKYVTYPQYSSCDYPTYAYSKRQCNKKQIKWIKAQLARNQS